MLVLRLPPTPPLLLLLLLLCPFSFVFIEQARGAIPAIGNTPAVDVGKTSSLYKTAQNSDEALDMLCTGSTKRGGGAVGGSVSKKVKFPVSEQEFQRLLKEGFKEGEEPDIIPEAQNNSDRVFVPLNVKLYRSNQENVKGKQLFPRQNAVDVRYFVCGDGVSVGCYRYTFSEGVEVVLRGKMGQVQESDKLIMYVTVIQSSQTSNAHTEVLSDFYKLRNTNVKGLHHVKLKRFQPNKYAVNGMILRNRPGSEVYYHVDVSLGDMSKNVVWPVMQKHITEQRKKRQLALRQLTMILPALASSIQ
eukprot:Nk52_evm61s153 gene=Nk52_evmTU61s153